MSVKSFLELVEIRTKVASFFPFVMGVLFSITYFNEVHWGYTLLFFIAMLVFDMTTTAINNYMDFQKANVDEYKYQQNVIGREDLSPTLVRNLILGMLGFTLLLGLFKLENGLVTLDYGLYCLFYWCLLYIWTDSFVSDAFG